MFCRRLGRPIGRIYDHNTAPGRRVEVNAIYTNARASNDTQARANAVHHLTCHKSFSPNNDRISRRCFRVPIIAFAYAADRNASQAFKYSQGRWLQHSTRPYMCLRYTRPFFFDSPVFLSTSTLKVLLCVQFHATDFMWRSDQLLAL